jgi:hypothetical protein
MPGPQPVDLVQFAHSSAALAVDTARQESPTTHPHATGRRRPRRRH